MTLFSHFGHFISSTPEGVQVGESGLYPLGAWAPLQQQGQRMQRRPMRGVPLPPPDTHTRAAAAFGRASTAF